MSSVRDARCQSSCSAVEAPVPGSESSKEKNIETKTGVRLRMAASPKFISLWASGVLPRKNKVEGRRASRRVFVVEANDTLCLVMQHRCLKTRDLKDLRGSWGTDEKVLEVLRGLMQAASHLSFSVRSPSVDDPELSNLYLLARDVVRTFWGVVRTCTAGGGEAFAPPPPRLLSPPYISVEKRSGQMSSAESEIAREAKGGYFKQNSELETRARIASVYCKRANSLLSNSKSGHVE